MTRASYKTMTPAHERNLVRRVKRGCEVSARELLEAHAGFLHQQAAHYSLVEGIEFDDALQEARVGFIHGTKRFSTKRGFRLLTYAAHWVRHYCKRAVENSVGDIRIPVHAQQKMKKATGKFTPMRAKRLDARVPGAEDLCMLDMVPSNDAPPDDAAAESRRRAKIKAAYREAIATLTPRERAIAVERLSRPDPDKTTLEALGIRFGISRERVRQVERETATKLRTRIQKMGGKALLAA